MNYEDDDEQLNIEKNLKKKVMFTETAKAMEDLKTKFPYYTDILNAFKSGKSTASLRKRYMLKMIDEAWIRAIEDTIPCLDVIIRNPGVFLQEREEILPVEMTRKVTGRSVEHLSQHTDYINEIRPDGTVVPSKLLNVFQEDTVLTYENKFINTLLNRMYGFVCLRYDAASECGEDEKNTEINIKQEFEHDEVYGRISLSIEVFEKIKEHEVVKNYIYTSDIWKRVKRIKRIVDTYMASNFVQRLGRNYLRPPIMRTNKLLKNVDFRQCLALWEFLDSYENTGYETLIQEDVEDIDENCIKDLYNSIVAQYVLFQKNVDNDFVDGKILDSREVGVLQPNIQEELDPLSEKEYDYHVSVPEVEETSVTETGLEDQIEMAIKVALKADDELNEIEEQEKFKYKYRFSFLSRLIFAQNPTQDYYTEIKNELLSYNKVKSNISWNFENFKQGRNKCARINCKGKTLYLYLPLNPSQFEESKYHQKDMSGNKNFADIPFLLKVKSDRGVKYAKELIAIVMQNLGLTKQENFVPSNYHMAYATPDELARRNPPLVKLLDGSIVLDELPPQAEENVEVEEQSGINYKYRYSFMARLIQSQQNIQDYYGLIKNELLSYNKVKAKTSWSCENFKSGLNKVSRICIKGKSIYLYLPLNPNDFALSKYHQKDMSENKNFADIPFLLKVKSDRSAKYAIELIGIVMQNLGLTKQENFVPSNYRMKYQTTEQLILCNPPLVKLLDKSIEIPQNIEEKPENMQENDENIDILPENAEKGGINYKYKYSYMARLIQSCDELKNSYGEIKNYILSFKKVKSKISWGYEAFKCGKQNAIKMKVKGKSLTIYMAFKNTELDEKYHTKLLQDKNGNIKDLSIQLKVRSARSVKYAKELINKLMAEFNMEQGDIPTVNYYLPFETTENLINLEKPLIIDLQNKAKK